MVPWLRADVPVTGQEHAGKARLLLLRVHDARLGDEERFRYAFAAVALLRVVLLSDQFVQLSGYFEPLWVLVTGLIAG